LGLKDAKGAVITAVEQGSLAQFAGLRRGQVIVRVAEKPLDSAAALKEAVEKASLEDGVVFLVRTQQGVTRRVLIKTTGE
jgi:S1-C subfamily serine protease